ncbi:MAG: hypothetical protein FWG53_01705 [Clostridiales bacterium]|nr:hypothetical protein [Clostridiales bacterium]
MKVQEAKRQIRLREWATQINMCRQSGLTVKEWCRENGIHLKTYYNRMKRVREEMLEAIEAGSIAQVPGLAGIGGGSMQLSKPDLNDRSGSVVLMQQADPVFAALPMPKNKGASVTVWIGKCAVDIQNGSDGAVVEQVLKVVSRL